MTVNNNAVVSWFDARKGKLTYSMYGSRNGADGTADCSGSITQAIRDAGGSPYAYLYSTVMLGGYLSANGFTRISKNQSWDAQRGDIVLMSWGADMSTSGGAGGHVGVMKDATSFISTDYWTGGQAGTAVTEHIWNQYYAIQKPNYIEVWRNSTTQATTKPPVKQQSKPTPVPTKSSIQKFKDAGNKYTVSASFNVSQVAIYAGIWQVISSDLGGTDFKLNGIPLDCITFCNADGSRHANQTCNGSQPRFVFNGEYNHGTIDAYDYPTNAVGIDFGGYGRIWFNADAWLKA